MLGVKFPRFPILSFGVLFCLPLYPFTPHFFEILTKVERLISGFLFCFFVCFFFAVAICLQGAAASGLDTKI